MSNRSMAAAKAGFKPKANAPTPKPAKAQAKAPPPAAKEPIKIDTDESDDSDVEREEENQPMDSGDDQFPVLKEAKQKKAKSGANGGQRSTITFRRIPTNAPFQINTLLFFKNFESFTFLVSPTDAKAINDDLVANFGVDPTKQLVKYSDDWQSWMLRGKPTGPLKASYEGIPVKRSYTIQFNVGEWANSADMTSGVSAQIVNMFDSEGNSLAKAPEVDFPAHSTYSAGRLLTKEEAEEMKRSA